MGITCGIVGLPNVGMSTIVNSQPGAGAAAESYPFSTIEPNVGMARVPDPRVGEIAAITGSRAVVPATVEFVDIAGLVEGASTGEGLGNQFLHHIRQTDAIAHVVRCFTDPNVAHVAGRLDPVSDIVTIDTELALADLGTITRSREKNAKRAATRDPDARALMPVVARLDEHLSAGLPARSLTFNAEERPIVRDLFLLTAKPVMYLANVGEDDQDDSSGIVGAVRDHAAGEGVNAVVVVAGAIESEMAMLDPEDRAEMLEGVGLAEPGLDRVVHAAYDLLGLLTFLTTTEKESRAWPVQQGTTAWEAAGEIHTDFQRGFVRAGVVPYEDFVASGGEAGAREAGTWRVEGRDYAVREGDVIRFHHNA